jgi:hypothetical protein
MSYLNAFVPSPKSSSRSVKTAWEGLDRLHTQDTGYLSEAKNISVRAYPFIESAKGEAAIYECGDGISAAYETLESVHATGENTYVGFSWIGGSLNAFYFNGTKITGLGAIAGVTPANAKKLSVAAFNVYTEPEDGNIVTATYERRILIYPYCYSFNPESDKPVLASFNKTDNPVPTLDKVTVQGGRVFGVKDGKFFASAWNDYTDWILPDANTTEDEAPAMAWVSTSQSDIDASGEFTGITVYDGQVIGFKRNFMHMLYNNKNPFRIVDVAKVGAISQEAICEVGQVLFFVAEDGVYAFTGGTPTRISDVLDISNYEGSVLAGDDKTLYCYVPSESRTFTYDTVYNKWGVIVTPAMKCGAKVGTRCFIGNDRGIYALNEGVCGDFFLTTDISFGGALVEKKISRARLQVIHNTHRSGDYIRIEIQKASGIPVASKEFTPSTVCNKVLSFISHMTCDFGHKVKISGRGDWEIRYLQFDYEQGGESYA